MIDLKAFYFAIRLFNRMHTMRTVTQKNLVSELMRDLLRLKHGFYLHRGYVEQEIFSQGLSLLLCHHPVKFFILALVMITFFYFWFSSLNTMTLVGRGIACQELASGT